MKNVEALDTFEEKGIHVFTFNDAVRILGKERAYVRLILNRLAERNILYRAERGVYYTKKASPMEIASNIIQPSYVSLMSALSYYGVTTQIPIVIEVITPKKHGEILLSGARKNRIVFKTTNKSKIFGFYRDKNNISIAELEKALIDALYFKEPGIGQISEAMEAALKERKAKIEKIREYAELMGSKVLVKRLNSILGGIGANKWNFLTEGA